MATKVAKMATKVAKMATKVAKMATKVAKQPIPNKQFYYQKKHISLKRSALNADKKI